MLYIANSFSLQMLKDFSTNLDIERRDGQIYDVLATLHWCCGHDVKSVIGHKATADAVAHLLEGFDPEERYTSKEQARSWAKFNRESITLNKGDYVLVFQYAKGRLDEGTILNSVKEEDFKIFLVEVK